MKHSILNGILAVLVLAVCVADASAGCLNSLTTASSITSKVRGLYVNAGVSSGHHYVVLDKATCTSGAGDTTLASGTKSSYYLAFKADDKATMSMLLSAQATGAVVMFRLNPTVGAVANGVNEIGYMISPASAASQ